MLNIPWKSVHWANSLFLIGTFILTVTAVPLYLWREGLDPFQLGLFLVFFAATGLSITLGYHRLFSHLSFKASWPVRMLTLLFGAAAFENSVLRWAADHRQHHKCVDHPDDPYDISKGFFHAHIGWILFKLAPDTSLDNVKDLQRDSLVQWQHRNYLAIAVLMGFGLPALLGGLWNGWSGALGGFLIGGVARVFFVQQMTFFINSLCHTLGRQPYSSRCSARDSGIMALFTFGEGYHNFHHQFQHDYRNGVKPWQFDPTKWAIWLLHRLGLVSQLRRVPDEEILLAEMAEQERKLAAHLEKHGLALAQNVRQLLETAQERVQNALNSWKERQVEYRKAAEKKLEISRERMAELRHEFSTATEQLREAVREWRKTCQLAETLLSAA